ncbi:MAG: hypothetical protein ACXWVD_00275 [Telluria sp.]
MTLRLSTALRNLMLGGGSLKDSLQGGKIKIYSGTQPATADAAPTGTLLCTITDASGAHTQEVRATGTVTLSGSSGSIDALTINAEPVIGAAVAFTTDLATTATLLATAINEYQSVPKFTASAASGVVTITAPRGLGAECNGWVVDATCTTMTSTDVNLSGGVSAVNGLKFGVAAAGVLPKLSSQTWSGVAGATGTAGWFRFEGPTADSGALDSSEAQVRLDGSISTSGAQLNMSSTSITSAATQTITSFPITLPTS